MGCQGYRRSTAPPGDALAGSAMMRGMSSAAEISSLSSSMEELHRRVTAMAEAALNQGDEDMAHELIAVERALGGALRRLQRYASR
jgi:phage shock protein A